MATIRGICKNCGSLIIFDDRDELCECVFCNCVFPGKEAIEIMKNPDLVKEFPNEKFDKNENGKHYYSTPVMPDYVTPAVNRDKLAKSSNDSRTVGKIEFEISPKDVKAPKKTVIIIAASILLIIGIVASVSVPLYKTRTSEYKKLTANINTIFADVIDVDTSVDDDGYSVGYSINGLKAQKLCVLTNDVVSEEQARTVFENYCQERSEVRNDDSDIYADVEVIIYCNGGIYTVSSDKSGDITVDFVPQADAD